MNSAMFMNSNDFFSLIDHMMNQITQIKMNYEYLPNSSKPIILLEDLNSQINKMFDQIQEQPLDSTQVDALTTLCRLLNEDETLQKIRDQNTRYAFN